LKIAQVAPLYESVPPTAYGGTERVVSYLTEELVRRGHDVTLFASGDSVTRARLVPCCKRSLRLDSDCQDQLAYHCIMLDRVFQMANRFDLIHFHIDYLHFPLSQRLAPPHVSTLHGRLDLPDLQPLYRQFANMPLISISDAQRKPLAWANWQGTVYHGLPTDLHRFREQPGQYLAFLGRISPEKRPDRAIEIACATEIPLRIAAKISNVDYQYYKDQIEPLIQRCGSLVEFIGEVGGQDKDDFLGNALALLFPIDWPEPFGLVMIESMACGTPVIAFPGGSVEEIMEDGKSGFIVSTVEEAVRAVGKLGSLPRASCREVFERRFSAERMTEDYLAIYRRIVQRQRHRVPQPIGEADGLGAPLRRIARTANGTAAGFNGHSEGNERKVRGQRLPG